MKKIAVLAGPYKENLTAEEVEFQIKRAFKDNLLGAETKYFWMADGGRGTAKRIAGLYGAKRKSMQVVGPNYSNVRAEIFINDKSKIALFDVAEACGIHLLKKEERNPSKTTSFGVGEIIKSLLDWGCKEMIICLGDTGVNDGGIGMLQALGWKFYDTNHVLLPRERFDFTQISDYDPGRTISAEVTVLCDGITTLCGKEGISIKSAEKKGGSKLSAEKLEEEMVNVNRLFMRISGKNFSKIRSSGSGGGIGAGIGAISNAIYHGGAKFILERYELEKKLEGSNLIITSEGEINEQTIEGKYPYVISKNFKALGIPTIIFVGKKGRGFSRIYNEGTIGIFETDIEDIPFENRNKNISKRFIYEKSKQIAKLLSLKC